MAHRRIPVLLGWLGALAALAVGCSVPSGAPAPLEAVSPLPAPSVPTWITAISPTGSVGTLAQIRVIFAQPLLPVGALGSDAERDVLAHFAISPALPGHFRVLTPRMIGFEADRALPIATRVRVTLTSGLRDVSGHKLASDVAWTFSTTALKLLPADGSSDAEPANGHIVGLHPTFRLTANAPLDVASLAERTSFVAQSGTRTGASVMLESSPSPAPTDASQAFDESNESFVYDVTPNGTLDKATHYRLNVDAGAVPAHGNMPADSGYSVPFATYSPLRLVSATPTADPYAESGDGRFENGDPALVFNNPVDPKALDANVTLSPAPQSAGKLITLSDDGLTAYLNPYDLVPRTAYRVTLGPALADTFGQTIDSTSASAQFTTSDLAPSLWAPDGMNVFARTVGLQLQYTAVNLPGDAYRATYHVVDPAELAYGPNALPSPSQWPAQHVAGAVHNVQSTIDVPVERYLGAPTGMLSYGVTANIPNFSPILGQVQLTDLGLFAQWFPQSGFVMMHHLHDGSTVVGARVDVYRAGYADAGTPLPLPSPCASATTDASGAASFAGSAIERCSTGIRYSDEAPTLLVVAHSGADWVATRIESWSGPFADFDGDLSWTGGTALTRGAIFSDRDLYQPGQRGWFTAICYVLQNGSLRAQRHARYSISLSDPDGNVRKLAPQETNDYATFAFPIDFGRAQALGYYTLTATGPDGEKITGSFRVAEFKPPNFNVTLALDKQFAAAGSPVHASAIARYLFGTPMSSAHATFHVTRQSAFFTPQGWEQYTFGRQWFWPDQQPDVESDVLSQPVTLDAQGTSATDVHVDNDLPFAMTYQVDLEATDVSNLSSADTKSFTALPSESLIGLHGDFVGTANAPMPIGVVVVDPNGKTQPGKSVHIELQKMQYSSVTQVVEGGDAARDQVQYTTVARADVTSGDKPVIASLTPTDSGSYRIRANFAGASSETTATDTELWVTGPGQASWAQQNASQLQMQLDKKVYGIGDVATLAVASPYGRADLYVYVVRDHVLYKSVVHVNGQAPRVRIPVTPDVFPNAAVEGVLVPRGLTLDSKTAQHLDSLVKFGLVPLRLDLNKRYLTLTLHPQFAKLEPGAHQHVHLTLHDKSGAAVRGQLTVIVANEAVLQLSGYRPPDLVKTVFAEQPISTRFADSRPSMQLKIRGGREDAAKGWGYGGGFLAGAAGTRVRTNFQPLAYFAGSVLTDANGVADVSFTLPDDLTTWRVMAVGLSSADDPHFGNADTTFVTSKPLVTNALLPQFARTGDQIDAGLALLNTGAASATAQTAGTLGGALRFAAPYSGQSATDQREMPSGLSAWRFPMLVGAGTQATVQFRTALGTASDAFREPLEIRNGDVTESQIDSGATAGDARIPLAVGAERGMLRVTLANSLVPQASSLAQHALDDDQLDLLVPIASRLSIASSLLSLERTTASAVTNQNVRAIADRSVAQLASLQRSDGGFAFWSGERQSDAIGSAFAVRALAYAQAEGVTVGAQIERAKPYVVHALADPRSVDQYCTDDRCKTAIRFVMLQTLADLGDRRNDFLADIYAQRDTFGTGEKIALARYLLAIPGWSSQADALVSDIEQHVYYTGRNATVQNETGYWWYSAVPAQAAYLELLLERHAPLDRTDAALRVLLAQRCRCGWLSQPDSATALHAVAHYARSEPTPQAMDVTVTVDGKPAGTAHLDGGKPSAEDVVVNASALAAGNHAVVLQHGSGTLHYVVSYGYQLPPNAPGRIEGLRVSRTLRVANQTPVFAAFDLAPQSAPVQIAPGTVFDVGVEVIADHPVDHVVITDPLPAGFEAVDTSFQTTAAYYQPAQDSWEIDYQQIYKDRVMAFAQHLDAGVYTFHYLARAVTPGTYLWPGAQARLLYAPEEFGRAAFGTAAISP